MIGACALFGHVWEHHQGYRSQGAVIRSLVLPEGLTSADREQLEHAYQCDLEPALDLQEQSGQPSLGPDELATGPLSLLWLNDPLQHLTLWQTICANRPRPRHAGNADG